MVKRLTRGMYRHLLMALFIATPFFILAYLEGGWWSLVWAFVMWASLVTSAAYSGQCALQIAMFRDGNYVLSKDKLAGGGFGPWRVGVVSSDEELAHWLVKRGTVTYTFYADKIEAGNSKEVVL